MVIRVVVDYLTLVGPVVSVLNVLDLKSPVVRALGMQNLKPLVVRVRERGAGQDVEVTPSYPGYLWDRWSILLASTGEGSRAKDGGLTSASDTVLSAKFRTLQCRNAVPPSCTVTFETVLLSFASFTLCRSSRLLNHNAFQSAGMLYGTRRSATFRKKFPLSRESQSNSWICQLFSFKLLTPLDFSTYRSFSPELRRRRVYCTRRAQEERDWRKPFVCRWRRESARGEVVRWE